MRLNAHISYCIFPANYSNGFQHFSFVQMAYGV
jgi:hypothetical protein